MLRDIVMLAVGFGIGWVFFKRPQWATDLIAKIKGYLPWVKSGT